MLASIADAHPNFGRDNGVLQTMAGYSSAPFVKTRILRDIDSLAPISAGISLDNDVTQFIRPRTLVENMETIPAVVDKAQYAPASCADAQRHWKTCSKCRRREFFMVVLEMMAYILTGVMLIFTLKDK